MGADFEQFSLLSLEYREIASRIICFIAFTVLSMICKTICDDRDVLNILVHPTVGLAMTYKLGTKN